MIFLSFVLKAITFGRSLGLSVIIKSNIQISYFKRIGRLKEDSTATSQRSLHSPSWIRFSAVEKEMDDFFFTQRYETDWANVKLVDDFL